MRRRRGLAPWAAALLLLAAPAAGQDLDDPVQAIPPDLQHELEAEMSVERAREAEAQEEFETQLRERFDSNMGGAPDRARENDLERQIEQRRSGNEGRETATTACFASLQDLRESPGDPLLHRVLRVRDFAAAEPPAARSAADDRAVADVDIACVGGARVSALPGGGFRARSTALDFVAILYRDSSWWERDALDPARRLRHAQVHFDLAEVVARQNSQRLAEVVDLMAGEGETEAAALAELDRQYDSLLRTARRNLTEIAARYDRETKNGIASEAQDKWTARARTGLSRAPRTNPPAGVAAAPSVP